MSGDDIQRAARAAAAEFRFGGDDGTLFLLKRAHGWVETGECGPEDWVETRRLAALLLAQRAPLDARISELEADVARGREAGRAEERRDVVAAIMATEDHWAYSTSCPSTIIGVIRASIERGAHVGAAKEAGDG